MHKYVYLFSEGKGSMRELLGGKGANLAEMTNLGLPVPQGFTITTEACTQYYADGEQINEDIQSQIMEYIVKMEEITGKKFGDLDKPLLVSVRSGARASMPGMMDTILNLGLNDEVVKVMAEKSGNPRWGYQVKSGGAAAALASHRHKTHGSTGSGVREGERENEGLRCAITAWERNINKIGRAHV